MEDNVHMLVIDREDIKHDCEGPTDMGLSLMEILKAHDMPILATCGGMGLCSTCHIYIRSNHELPERSDVEEDALDTAVDVDETCSRLACQIRIKQELEGLVVELAPED